MSICDPCRNAADGKTPRRPHCPVCGRQIEVTRTDVRPEYEQRLYAHGQNGARCSGSKGPPVYRNVGHCDGKCPCQHRQKGAWRGGPAN